MPSVQKCILGCAKKEEMIEMVRIDVIFKRNGLEVLAKIEDGKWKFYNSLTKQWVDDIDSIHDLVITEDEFRDFCELKKNIRNAIRGNE
jgi:hypothetical protein